MKKIALFMAALLLLVSCDRLQQNQLLGVWRFERITSYDYTTGKEELAGTNWKTITFKRGGIGYQNDNPITYKLQGDELSITWEGSTTTTVNVNRQERLTNTYTIDELTRDRLQISQDYLDYNKKKHKSTFYFSRFE